MALMGLFIPQKIFSNIKGKISSRIVAIKILLNSVKQLAIKVMAYLPIIQILVMIVYLGYGLNFYLLHCSSSNSKESLEAFEKHDKAKQPIFNFETATNNTEVIWHAIISNLSYYDKRIIPPIDSMKISDYCMHYNRMIKILYITVMGSIYMAILIALMALLPVICRKLQHLLPDTSANIKTRFSFVYYLILFRLFLTIINNMLTLFASIIILYCLPLPV